MSPHFQGVPALVDCDGEKVPVMLSPGQIINPAKVCKRHKEGKLQAFMERTRR